MARAEDRGAQRSASRRGRPVPGLPQRQENAGFAAVVARGGGPRWPRKCLPQGSASSGASTTAGKCRIRCRCGRPVPGLPQRQENAGFAAVVARGGGPGCLGKHLSQGSASSGASATAGKCRFCCRCGKGRRTGVPREAPLAGDGQFRDFRNGRKMWDLLPLWQGRRSKGRRTGMPQRAEGRTGRTGRSRPQVPTR